MKIVVTAKFVPSVSGAEHFESEMEGHRHTDGRLSEFDEYAIEAALQLKEELGAHIVVLSMGPQHAAEAIRKALEMGADEAVLIIDEALRGSDAVATSLVLARAIERIDDVDMVMMGMTSADGSMGVMPSMLAERLHLPQLTYADNVCVEDGAVSIRREGGRHVEMLTAELPAVISVSDRINEPRYPTFREIMAARSKRIIVWTLDDLDIDRGQVGYGASRVRVHSIISRPARRQGPIVRDDGRGGEILAEFLIRGGFVPAEGD